MTVSSDSTIFLFFYFISEARVFARAVSITRGDGVIRPVKRQVRFWQPLSLSLSLSLRVN
jgi:hypothetical protein